MTPDIEGNKSSDQNPTKYSDPNWLNERVSGMLDDAYDQGVDHALIEIYEKKRIYESIHRANRGLPMLELFFDEIIVKL